MHDIDINLAQADRAAWAALYAPAATAAAVPVAGATGNSNSKGLSSMGNNGTVQPISGSVVFIPPPQPLAATSADNSSGSSSSPPSSVTALLPVSHIDADID